MKSKNVLTAALSAASICFAASAHAEEPCGAHISRTNVVRCAWAASLTVRIEERTEEAALGRRESVSRLLPSNPVLSMNLSRRETASEVVPNWDATLSQELEVAGQRGLRRDSADEEVLAQNKRVEIARRDVAAVAWATYFEVIAARDERELVDRQIETATAVSRAVHARADKGLIAPLDADVADAALLRLVQSKLTAERALAVATASLSTLEGIDLSTALTVEGDLAPVDVEREARSALLQSIDTRPEVQSAEAERRAMELRADAYRRARVPNPTLSVFVRNDEINDHVIGVGLAFPIPVPGIGRVYSGEVAESEALARRAQAESDRARRTIRLAITTALQAYESRRAETEIFSADRLQRAEDGLKAIAAEVDAGRLTVRDAVVTQQALIDVLLANVEAHHQLAHASVELARAAGISLEG
ncbi:MAG: TolC family protein, partial [Polyangiaceae bacterium]